jgi:raffinose/stachyose/melibiose transport system substrate-binding protein
MRETGMVQMRKTLAVAAGATAALLLAACSGTSTAKKESVSAPTDPSKVSGTITVLTNRTDLVQDGTLKKYAAEFKKVYPKVTVKFQGITNYEDDVKIRMNTDKYGDVLLIPNAIQRKDYPSFFVSLGTPAELSKKYRYTSSATVNGQVYGVADFGNANGFVYNKDVWKQAGITTWPTTTAQFLSDLQAIKQKTTSTPYYTNYHDGWPLTTWQSVVGSVSCSAGANDALASTPEPWAKGKELNTIDSLLYNIVHEKLAEADPTTTNWENSKGLLANGKIATMWLGSWAIIQMQDAAKKAGKDPSEIGFMPFPTKVDGHFCSVSAPDYQQAVSIHSTHKAAARAWIDWFTDKSGFAAAQGSLPTLVNGSLPSTLQPYQDEGVKLIELSQAKAVQVNNIDNESEVGLLKPDYRQKIVDTARGAAGGSLDSIFSDLDSKWKPAEKAGGS